MYYTVSVEAFDNFSQMVSAKVTIAQLRRNAISIGGSPYFGMNLKIEIGEFPLSNLSLID